MMPIMDFALAMAQVLLSWRLNFVCNWLTDRDGPTSRFFLTLAKLMILWTKTVLYIFCASMVWDLT